MTEPHVPRVVTSVLVEEDSQSVTVTWGLGGPAAPDKPEFFGYGMYYYDPTGNGGKRFGVRFGESVTAWVFDNASATQANYVSDSVTASEDAVVVHYRDASLELAKIGTIAAYAHVEGRDEQLDIPVTLLR
ncbi:hypothetical protein [uncultured Microbacterium sp.]|uniref:hypothetical protein n=1 Tax=uncultured Microbacterium sp. TaxID=191216 RepID=UPI0028D10B15|nr:hypothetical protein [uncultured Microbacterium sp.]